MGITAPSPLTEAYDVSAFDCGNITLNEWLLKRALKNQHAGASRTFVVCDDRCVVGFYSLAVGAIARKETPAKVNRNMPDPIPVMILARLAVDHDWQGRHIGSGMLKDAIQRSLLVSQQAGLRALLVHAISEDAKRFYQSWGFYSSPTDEMTLMITLAEAQQSLQKAAHQR